MQLRLLLIPILVMILGGQPRLSGAEQGQLAVVQFLDDGRYLRVPLQCFGKTLFFVLDTGTSITVFDGSHQEELGASIRTRPASTPSGKLTEMSIFKAPQFSVGTVRSAVTEVLCVDIRNISELTGEQCDGILGMDFLKDYALTFDFEDKALIFGSAAPSGMQQGAITVPMEPAKSRHFAVSARINAALEINLMLDTGDSRALSLNPKDWSTVFPEGSGTKTLHTQMATVDGKTQDTLLARISSLKIGSSEIPNLISAQSPNPESLSTLGLGFFRRYSVCLDFPNRTVYLNPGDHFKDEDEVNMAGLHILRSNHDTLVHSVDSGSPAEAIGMKSGDKILKVDGALAFQMPLEEIRKRLKSGDGKEVSLRLKRDDQMLEVVLHLKKEL